MESQPVERQAATDGKELHMTNKRTLEFFFLAALLGIGAPVATLIGVAHGEKQAVIAYPHTETARIPNVDYKDIVMGTPGDEEKGHALFQTNCVACHGPAADGQGPAATALKPAPRNFIDPQEKWTHGRNLPDIYHTISNGSPGTAMVGFSASLSVQDRWAIVHYLASLPGVKGQYLPMEEAIAAAWRPEKTP